MRKIRKVGAWLILLILIAVTGILHGEPRKDPDKARIAELVQQLGDKKYARRIDAGKELRAIGEKALPAVREVEKSQDLEVSTRARSVGRTIMRDAGKSKTTGMELILVDDDSFVMGSPRIERSRRVDETQHRVRITRPFLIGKYEVTQEEFEKLMEFNPSSFSAKGADRQKVAA